MGQPFTRAERREHDAEVRRAMRRERRQEREQRRRWGGRAVPDEDTLMAREQSTEEFDADDLVRVDGGPEPCFHCGLPSDVVSLTFEARLHPRCADGAWAAYFRALRG